MNVLKQALTKEEIEAIKAKQIRLHVVNDSTGKKYTFVVPPLKLSQSKKIIDALNGIDSISESASLFDVFTNLLSIHYDKVIYCVAIATIHPQAKPDKSYLRLIGSIMDSEDLYKLWTIVIRQLNPAPFVLGIAHMKGIELRQS